MTMKNFIIIALLCLLFTACKKDIPEPDVIRMDVYSTKIKHTNYNEPDILYWFIRKANKGGYFYIATTRDVKNFSDYKFNYAIEIPDDLKGKSKINEVVVWINQLNGDMLFDITGKTDLSPGLE